MEDVFWDAFKEIAAAQGTSRLIESIDSKRQDTNLSSAIRLFVLDYYKRRPAMKRTGRA
jgi:predicted DNA-binding ribbon-helix-helix protein